jgi:pilus assembly protein CpaE
MKVKVIAPQRERADELAKTVGEAAPGSEVLSAKSAAGELLTAVNGSRPNLLVIDEVDAPTLVELHRLTQSFPEVDSIIISQEQSPQFLMTAMRAGVREVLPSPLDPLALTAAVQRMARKHGTARTSGKHGKVFAFISCKGGNGSSFLAANMASVLAKRPDVQVAMLDFDLQFGDSLMMLTDQRASSDIAEVAENIERLDESLLKAAMVQVTPQLHVLAAPGDLSQALSIKPNHVEAILRQCRQMFDFVVMDVSRSIDSVSLKALDLADEIMPVMQLTVPNVRDAKRLRDLFRSLEYPAHKIRWVINRHQKDTDVTVDAFEQALGTKSTITIPNHHASVAAAVNQGLPIDQIAKSSAVAKSIVQMADTIAPPEVQRKEGWLASIFGPRN